MWVVVNWRVPDTWQCHWGHISNTQRAWPFRSRVRFMPTASGWVGGPEPQWNLWWNSVVALKELWSCDNHAAVLAMALVVIPSCRPMASPTHASSSIVSGSYCDGGRTRVRENHVHSLSAISYPICVECMSHPLLLPFPIPSTSLSLSYYYELVTLLTNFECTVIRFSNRKSGWK